MEVVKIIYRIRIVMLEAMVIVKLTLIVKTRI